MNSTDQFILDNIAQRALSSKETIYNSFLMAEHCIVNKIEGDFCECGVFAGAQCGAMAYAITKHRSDKKIHMFDSFEGIPMAGVNDIEIRGCIGVPSKEDEGKLKTSGISACTVEQVKKHMSEWGFPESRFIYHKGWFQNSLPTAKVGKLSLLRLDGDLYESTKVCLEHLGKLVQPNGVFIIDDWALDGCRQAVLEYWIEQKINPEIKNILNSTPIFWFK